MLPHPSEQVVFCPVESGAVLLHSGTEVYFGLNEVGALIWQHLPPKSSSVAELVEMLRARYTDVDAAVLERDILELLTALREQQLVLGPDA